MSKGIYVGVGGNLVTGDIIPKTWTGSISPYKSNGITLTASGEASGYPATNACDGNTSTNTYYSGATDYWIKLQFPTAQKITKMKTWITALSDTYFSNAIIQGSNDDSVWNDLYTITSAQTALTAITLNNPNYYKYYRIYATSTYAARPPMVYEWQVSEYIQNPVARKVKKAYIGVDGVARKIKKGYIGVDGVAKQFYSAETLVPFTSNPVPTSWTDVNYGLDGTATNEYGEWSINTSSIYSTNYPILRAFNDDDSNFWRSGDASATAAQIYLYCPTGIYIKPNTISIRYARLGETNIYGFNPSAGAWVKICTTTKKSTTIYTETFNYTGDIYFSAFRIPAIYYSNSYLDRRIYNFKITSGTLKIE